MLFTLSTALPAAISAISRLEWNEWMIDPRLFTKAYCSDPDSSALRGLALRFSEHTLLRVNQLSHYRVSQEWNLDLAFSGSEKEE
jgi:hypothetical protein